MNNFGVEEKLLFSLARDHARASLTPWDSLFCPECEAGAWDSLPLPLLLQPALLTPMLVFCSSENV